MKNNKLLLLIPILILCISFVSALDYNFVGNNNFFNSYSSTNVNSTGNFNNSHFLVAINSSLYKINVNTLVNDGVLGNNPCNTTILNNVLRLIDNRSICASNGGVISSYSNTGVLLISAGTSQPTARVFVSKYNSSLSWYYVFTNSGSNYKFPLTDTSLSGFNILPYINNTMNNNFGISINSMADFDDIIQVNQSDIVLKKGSRFFHIVEGVNQSFLSNDIEEIDFVYSEVSLGNELIVVNDKLFVFSKNSSNYTSLYTSSDVDIYSGLFLGSDNLYYKSSAVCFDGYFFSVDNGNMFCSYGIVGDYCFNESYMSVCSAGCTYQTKSNIYGVSYKEGTCLQENCSNECGVLGQRTSPSVNSVGVCGFSDSDGCLDLSVSYCADGEYSIEGYCETLNYSQSPIDFIGFDFSPYDSPYSQLGDLYCLPSKCEYQGYPAVLVCTNTNVECDNVDTLNPSIYSVDYDRNTRILDVKTRTDLGGNGVFELDVNVDGGNASDVIGVDCNYKSVLYSDVINASSNVGGLYVLPVNVTSKFSVDASSLSFYNKVSSSFVVNGLSSKFIVSFGDANYNASVLYVELNATTKEFVVRSQNSTGTLLYTDVYTGVVHSFTLDAYFDSLNYETNSILSLKDSSGFVLQSRGVVMQNFDSENLVAPWDVTIYPVLNVYLQKITRETFGSLPSIYNKLQVSGVKDFIKNYEYTGCNYSNSGSYTARVYLSEEYLGQYFSFKDINVKIERVNGNGVQNTPLVKSELSKNNKMVASFVISILLLGFFVIFGIMYKNQILIYVGCLVFVMSMIIFAIKDWMPVIVLVVSAILAGLIALFFVLKKSQGD